MVDGMENALTVVDGGRCGPGRCLWRHSLIMIMLHGVHRLQGMTSGCQANKESREKSIVFITRQSATRLARSGNVGRLALLHSKHDRVAAEHRSRRQSKELSTHRQYPLDLLVDLGVRVLVALEDVLAGAQ